MFVNSQKNKQYFLSFYLIEVISCGVMGKIKYKPEQVVGYEEKVRARIENNLKASEADFLRLMNVLTDRKAYDLLKDVERVRKRFNFLANKSKGIYPQKILRAEDQEKFSNPIIVNAMILIDELIYRDSLLFNKLVPTIEQVMFNPLAEDTLKKLLQHVSFMLTRLERLMTLKLNVKNQTGENVFKLMRNEIPEFFPKHFRSEIRKELEKNRFEDVELNLVQDEKYEKAFFEEIVGASTYYEQAIIQDVLADISVKFDGIKQEMGEMKAGQAIIQSQQDAIGKDIGTVYASIQEMRTVLTVKVDDFLTQSKEQENLVKQSLDLELQLDTANPGQRDVLTQRLMQIQIQYTELSKRIDANLNTISANVFSVLEKQDDAEVYMRKELGGEFSQISESWKLMKEGKITKKEFAKKTLVNIGKGFLKLFTPFGR